MVLFEEIALRDGWLQSFKFCYVGKMSSIQRKCVRASRKMAGDVLKCPKSFNNSGLLFTHIEENGKLKIWDTSTGILKQEFTKNFHLNSSCTSLIWLQTSKLSGHKKKKLKQSEKGGSLDVIALGSALGNITLFDVATNTVLEELEGHTSRVNSLTWSSENNSLYSCSDDKHIIEWDIIQHKIKSKWKVDKEKVCCILALSNGKNLLSAGYSIKLWDLEKKQVVKVFTGHGTEVTVLSEVPNRDGYFVSGAKGDRVLSVWSLNSKEKVINQVASLILQDPASSVQMINYGIDMSTILYAVTEGGVLQVFKHKFNGSLSKPLKPITNISIASESNESKQTHPVAIHAVLPLHNDKIVITYGSPPFLYFEIISLNENQQENVVLLRQDKKKIPAEEFNNKTKFPVASNDVDYQVPSITSLKRGSKKQVEVPLAERLENLALVNPQSSDGLKKDNMAQLLLQGLQSKDKAILQSVLFRTEQSVIDVTVKHLPVQALVPLIRELISFLHGKTFTGKCAVNWLNSVVRTHSGILLSNPELSAIFEPLLASIEARIAVLPPLLRLGGRLALVTQQIGNNMDEDKETLSEPVFTYQEEESSDEDFEKMSVEGSGTESEDNWDEYSDMGGDDREENDEKL